MTADLRFTRMKPIAVGAAALLLAACGSATDGTASTVTPPPAGKTVINAYGSYVPAIERDGTYVVNVDIQFWKYRSAGGPMCHWARLRSLDTSDEIESKTTSGPQEVLIRATDAAFLTKNCGTWQMAPLP